MPLIRKLIDIGNSKGITLPISWIQSLEDKNKGKLVEVSLDVNGNIVISPHAFKTRRGGSS